MKTISLDEVIDTHIGKVGTIKRDLFDTKIRMEKLGDTIKSERKKRNLTKKQLSEMAGIQKSILSKIEKSAFDFPIATILKVCKILDVKVIFSLEVNQNKILVAE